MNVKELIAVSALGALLVACASTSPRPLAAGAPLPIIDMHLHAHLLSDYGGGGSVCTNDQKIDFPGLDPRQPMTIERAMTCPSPIAAPATDEAVMTESLAALERHNIWAVTSGSLEVVSRWKAAARERIIPALSFATEGGAASPEEFRRLFTEGKFAVFAEVGAQYRGLRLDDDSFDAYFALAEELDIPVGVHLGEGPPGGTHVGGYPTYRARLTSALQLEEVMIRHPKLRLYVMHYGSPLVDDTIALLYSNPQVYVDIAQNDWGFPRAHFYSQLKRLMDAGFEKRILWGSDQMVWPQTIDAAIRTIEEAPFLSEEQKRDILYNNAARFLRLSQQEIARHHGR
jgi:predicted TIM-barrel fold metal-dependent hydrolase